MRTALSGSPLLSKNSSNFLTWYINPERSAHTPCAIPHVSHIQPLILYSFITQTLDKCLLHGRPDAGEIAGTRLASVLTILPERWTGKQAIVTQCAKSWAKSGINAAVHKAEAQPRLGASLKASWRMWCPGRDVKNDELATLKRRTCSKQRQ